MTFSQSNNVVWSLDRCLEILDAARASSYHAQQGRFVHVDLSSLNPLVSMLLRIVLDVITSSFSLGYSTWALESTKLNFHTSGWFSCSYKHVGSISQLDMLCSRQKKKNIAAIPAALPITEFLICCLNKKLAISPQKLTAKHKLAGENPSQQVIIMLGA